MKQLFKMLVCWYKGHDYHWHFSDSPHNTTWYHCSRCHKNTWVTPGTKINKHD